MSHPYFEVGEIAILQNGIVTKQYDGELCQIVGGFGAYWGSYPDGRTELHGNCYRVRVSDGTFLISDQHQLRKLPPKQDWKKLCNLTDVPREVSHV